VSTVALAHSGGRVFLWSEKTTVCRIFNCKRALKLPAASLPLPALLSAAFAASFSQIYDTPTRD
jgi:hypothetical protein